MAYQIVSFAANKAQFVRISQAGNDEILFGSKVSMVPVTGGRVSMTSGSVTLNTPKSVTPAEGVVESSVNNSLKISFNIVKGDLTALTALRLEADRLLDAAIADYNLANGLVPTASATFPTI